jgi:hypothetical protein
MTDEKPQNIKELIGKWPNADAFADDLGLKWAGGHARLMKMRNRIPRVYWPEVVAGAAKRGIPNIDQGLIERLHSQVERAA